MTAAHPSSLDDDTALRRKIFQAMTDRGDGTLSFAEFMALCLYDSAHGYYAHPAHRPIGRAGDFYTSVSVGSGYGFFLGLALEHRWRDEFGSPQRFLVAEQGAHDGQLALDLLAGLRERRSPLLETGGFTYLIHEPDPDRRAFLVDRLKNESALRVVAAVPDPPAPAGIFLCNELLDAFPVHRLRRESGVWREWRVGASENSAFHWVAAPIPPDSPLAAAAAGIPEAHTLPEGYTTEVCLAYDEWMQSVARWFHPRGLWWIIDYGREAADYYSPARREGTLRGYRQHRLVADPFETPGRTDLTADVDFTRLARAARAAGLKPRGLEDQHRFLIRAAEPWLRDLERAGPTALAAQRQRLRQFQTLTHPELMGRSFNIAEYEQRGSDRQSNPVRSPTGQGRTGT